jgi:pimeloyl-ACP methyl ester carboxylesterase
VSGLRGTLLFALSAFLLVFLLAATLVWLGQRRLIFPGSRAFGAVEPESLGGERLWLDVDGARVEAWLLPARGSGPLLVYAHGNGELIDHWVEAFEPARARGASVLLVEYPGYGRSGGSTSAGSILAAMTTAYDFAQRERGFAGRPVVGWGRSIGGGAICALAGERPLAALVLESTFTSIVQMVRLFGVPGWLAPVLVRDRFDNLRLVRRFEGPMLVLHGEHDEMIPTEHARTLGEASSRVELRWLPCGHNDCERPWPLVLPFLSSHGLLADDGARP